VNTALTFLRGLYAVLMAVCVAAAVVGASTNCEAQQDNRPTVYLLDIKQEGESLLHGNLSDFTVDLLRMRLTELKSFQVKKLDKVSEADIAPKCGEARKTDALATTQVSLANDADFYVLRASIQVRTPAKAETEIVLDYELAKYVRCERVSLARSKDTFAENEVLKYINSMADVTALLLDNERTVTKAVADAITFGSDEKSWAIARKVTDELKADIKRAGDFYLPEKSNSTNSQTDFTVRGQLSITNKVSYRVTITTKDGRSYPPKTVMGPDADKQTDEKLASFYKEAADAAFDYLKYVRYVAEARRNTPLTEAELQQMLDRARQLMCVEVASAKDCKQQPETAILVLTEIRERKKPTDEELLGKAQMLVGEYSDAAQSFDSARSHADGSNPEVVINLLNQGGEAWFKAKNYDKAIARYEESLNLYNASRAKLSASLLKDEPRVSLQRVRSYRYAKKGLEALKFILSSWEVQPDPKDLREELGYLLDDMPAEQFNEAEKIVELYKGKPQYEAASLALKDHEAMDTLMDVLVSLRLRWLEPADQELKIFQEMDSRLTKVETIPETSLSGDSLTLRKTVRALWLRDFKHDTEQATYLLEQAVKANTEFSTLSKEFLAETYYQKAIAPGTRSPETLEKASSFLTNMAMESGDLSLFISSVYGMLRSVNHKLGKDKETRKLLEERAKQDKEDFTALASLSTLCTHYLADLQCGERVAQQLLSSARSPFRRLQAQALVGEIDVLKGDYAVAAKELESLQNSVPRGFIYEEWFPVLLFYRTWALLALGKEADAATVARQWKTEIANLRKNGTEVDWIFDGSLRALDAEATLTPTQKNLLRAMIASMDDKAAPLPLLP
jgi:tetratricopeptide (TPR) repeat protein